MLTSPSQGGKDDGDEHSQAIVQAALAKKYAGSRDWGAMHDASTMSAINPFASTIVGVGWMFCKLSWLPSYETANAMYHGRHRPPAEPIMQLPVFALPN
jgi:hypothetical protein